MLPAPTGSAPFSSGAWSRTARRRELETSHTNGIVSCPFSLDWRHLHEERRCQCAASQVQQAVLLVRLLDINMLCFLLSRDRRQRCCQNGVNYTYTHLISWCACRWQKTSQGLAAQRTSTQRKSAIYAGKQYPK